MYSLSDLSPQYLNAGLFLLALILLILLIATRRTLNQAHKNIAEKNDALLAQQQTYNETQERMGMLVEKSRQYEQVLAEKHQLSEASGVLQKEYSKLQAQYEAQKARLDALMQNHEEKLALMHSSEQRLQTQFENLANKIFDEKSATYQTQSKHNIEAVLAPFKSQLDGFKRQISEQHIREGQERASLKTEILSLKALNQRITEEASALTNALKGDNKKQGNWGEVILERILKESGLREGHEFETQVSAQSEQGRRLQPDVVVHLPNDKDVIIDSKVSLAAYEQYFNCDDDASRKQYLSAHVASIKGHIKGLGAKEYQSLKGLRTLDYVLLFIPIEPAFLLAIEEEPDLVSLALNHNIMLVSPTNLLVALRTINNIWQYEYQNQNAQLIAEQAGKLYDKFVGFVSDIEKIGKALDTAHGSYDAAMNKLSSGRGNLVRQVEKFREMGVQPSKRLDNTLSRLSDEE
ncbi:DNA recombination protein RmuC [Alteromonas sp. K632G]|jgi:DNA recombination protein RmuC|uniref:DNA recombination protein RmuC n=1 Tax=Alteromonas sp. K632G TaxID=2820757 RepID=UPI000C0D24B2|nr:DNA recombination protein RmuC [Alteromonas sp. K632G]MBO7922309.1 DNA recombination protein RmuC [Alteromonas sp. K632G]PHS60019.1 MAG: DNA recombination protein RmuC [Alteromonas sp.]|tara:strand:+ start:5157 stop:6548 length:1392 start_codon:yes stop_codon:yes gene_type:complete